MMKRLHRQMVTLVLAAAFTAASGAFAHAASWTHRPGGTTTSAIVQKPGATPTSGEPDTGSSSAPAAPKLGLSQVGSGQGTQARIWFRMWSNMWVNLYLWRVH